MDVPPVPHAADEHWAPDHIVLSRRVLTYAGRLFAARDAEGRVVTHAPLAGMAAVEQRYPAWALGPFGRVEPEFALPAAPGVFALVTDGVVRYVGASQDLEETFGTRRGIGEITRRDAQKRSTEERCRLNRLVTAEVGRGRTVDLYLLAVDSGGRRLWGRAADTPTAIAAEILSSTRGDWHLPE